MAADPIADLPREAADGRVPPPLMTTDLATALLQDLNEPQREAVLYGDGPLLILAGAGSGKTRVITRRIAHLVKVRNVFPWKVLAVTFTNKAAREMKERLVALLGEEARSLTVSTFHSAAAMILRREAEKVGLTRSFVIYDDGDQMQLVRRAIKTPIWIDVDRRARSVEQDRPAEELRDSSGSDESRLLGLSRPDRPEGLPPLPEPASAANAVDFNDLLLLLVELLKNHLDVREYYRQRYRYIMVDEFQDTNRIQYELLQLLAPPGKSNLAVVETTTSPSIGGAARKSKTF